MLAELENGEENTDTNRENQQNQTAPSPRTRENNQSADVVAFSDPRAHALTGMFSFTRLVNDDEVYLNDGIARSMFTATSRRRLLLSPPSVHGIDEAAIDEAAIAESHEADFQAWRAEGLARQNATIEQGNGRGSQLGNGNEEGEIGRDENASGAVAENTEDSGIVVVDSSSHPDLVFLALLPEDPILGSRYHVHTFIG